MEKEINENRQGQEEEKLQAEEPAAESQEEMVEGETSSDVEDSDKLAALEEKCSTLHNDYLRLYAEFDNYKKRAMKEKADLLKFGGEKILSNMLPLIDDFERAMSAMESASDMEGVKEGVSLIYGKFLSFLSQNDVKVIDTENKEFDTDFHEAIATIPAPSEELKGKILDCTQKGYTLSDKVIRFSKVVIGQ
ncbi:MAG: nucleotide exchange factor GrpE [Paludibacteraceae bacterium]|jgi:molecular chaperone GrpE|nr:nucleotide exchange factor GrpE [Paludibacteraceae bacterium]MBO5988628.1 nucleotide exchange factor GrpE [Paludibacteraceae bacterium]